MGMAGAQAVPGSVNVTVSGVTVLCGACDGPMRPVLGRNLDGEELEWLFWRCTRNRDHISVALPLPRASRY